MFVKHSIEACLCNNFCSAKALSITYFECVVLDLVIQHAMSICHIFMCGLSDYCIFLHYLINGKVFGKIVTEHKTCVLVFSITFI
jgi:hypothetical protein